MRMFFKQVFFALPLLLIIASCAKDPKNSTEEWEEQQMKSYIKINYPQLMNGESEIPASVERVDGGGYILEHKKSNNGGGKPLDEQFVLYDYEARYVNNSIFLTNDSIQDRYLKTFSYKTHYVPYYEQMNSYMAKGIYEVMKNLEEGDTVTFIVPSWQLSGYTIGQSRTITAPLIFTIQLREVVPDPAAREKEMVQAILDADPGFTTLYDSTGTALENIYVKYIDTVAYSDTTPYPKVGDIAFVKYAGYFLDSFLLDTNIDSIGAKFNWDVSRDSIFRDTIYFEYAYGGSKVITAFSVMLNNLAKGGVIDVIFTSDWGYMQYGSGSVYPYTPLRYTIYFKDLKREEDQ